jgi:hypothetical protein
LAAIRIVIQFAGPYETGLVISGAALRPELLMLVGYGDFLTQEKRTRLNYFFHRRKLPTVLTDPLILEPFLEPDMEAKLLNVLEKYASACPVIDISGADEAEALALGAVLARHPDWRFPVLDYRMETGVFLPQKHADVLRRLPFPSLLEEEILMLNQIKRTVSEEIPTLVRKDLTSTVVKAITKASRVFRERPAFWRQIALRLREAVGEEAEKPEYLLDAGSLSVPDETLRELLSLGLLSACSRRGGIIRLSFPDRKVRELLLNMDRIDLYRTYLVMAQIRNFRNKAAYHDLSMIGFDYVTGVIGAMPVVIGILPDEPEKEDIYRFYDDAVRLMGQPVRKILIIPEDAEAGSRILECAGRFGIETSGIRTLVQLLEPR